MAAVAAGALGAHALADYLAGIGRTAAWQTAVSYLFWHVLAGMAAIAWGAGRGANRWLTSAAALWLVGVILFSGSIILLCLGGPRWLGPVTPLGGVSLMAGWLAFGIAVWRSSGWTATGGGASIGSFSR